jgi:serine/threonine protein phosphatase PrpC
MQVTKWSDIGHRKSQQDNLGYFIFGSIHVAFVADGHGNENAIGGTCSVFVAHHFPLIVRKLLAESNAKKNPRYDFLLKKAVAIVVATWDKFALGPNQDISDPDFNNINLDVFEAEGKDSGTTLVAVLIDMERRRFYSLNLGDSRAIWRIGVGGGGTTIDHAVPKHTKVTTKYSRVVPIADGRVGSVLAMTRSIGDHIPQLAGLISRDPDIQMISFGKKEVFIIIGSDGLFEARTTQELLLEESKDAAALSLGKGQHQDNVSIIYIKIPAEPRISRSRRCEQLVPRCQRKQSIKRSRTR